MSEELEKFWSADKELSVDPDWKRREKDEFVRLVSPLDINGVTVEGLRFTVSAHIYMPDRSVTFQIEYESVQHPKGVPMVRFEWRPRSPHNNKGLGPLEYRYIALTGTHIHPFDLNWAYSQNQVRKGNLPIAVPVQQEIGSYDEALAFVETKFRIKGVTGIPAPPWTSKMI
ncbi:hypothetical protein A7A09_013815 [Paracoccus methylarcula]|uniref:Uncharacterized protein n=2 Tax=Paracoccus methylarcula TaxID=72022 RepID=A0A422QVI1_9RHOB|nr:hypothetical protein A7A09_013815 [Paracoccus methylarcula]